MRQLLFVLCFATFTQLLCAQQGLPPYVLPTDLRKIAVIQPTGERAGGLPEMVVLSDTNQLYLDAIHIAENSFIREIVDLYFLSQVFLKNAGEKEVIEPAYIALTKNQGGFAKTGFSLLKDGGHTEKPETPYVDIVENTVHADADRLMSVTQLYPHEMGHVIYRLLSSTDSVKEQSRSVDMHYFSIVTNYGTAFNEGFSEHIENVARLYERNDSLREGIFADIEKKRKSSSTHITGFTNDLMYPLRMGFYKASMAVWYQRYEDIKRYEQAIDKSIRYKNGTLDLRNAEDMLTFRNAGVSIDSSSLKNLPQQLATEGVVNAFFTTLTTSDLGKHYLPDTFYRAFVYDTTAIIPPAGQIFSPLQNQFLKYFYVLHNFVEMQRTQKSQLTDFIDGYIRSFPGEAGTVRCIFNEVTGLEYTNELPPELWLLIKNHRHRLLALDAFGALTIPVYSFDLNKAEVEDLMTIKGLDRKMAASIINYRNQHGFFTSLEQVKDVPGIQPATAELILRCNFDQSYLEGLPEPELSISALFIAPLKHILFKSLLYFFILAGATWLVFLRRKNLSGKQMASFLLRNFGYMLLFVVAGLFAVVACSRPALCFLAVPLTAMIFGILVFRKNWDRLQRWIFITVLMGFSVWLSLV